MCAQSARLNTPLNNNNHQKFKLVINPPSPIRISITEETTVSAAFDPPSNIIEITSFTEEGRILPRTILMIFMGNS